MGCKLCETGDAAYTVKHVFKRPLKKNNKIGFQYQLLLNAGQKYCRMLHGEHSAILSTFNNLPFSIKTFVLFILKWLLKTGFAVRNCCLHMPLYR